MKLVHHNAKAGTKRETMLSEALAHEAEKEWDKAADLYEDTIKAHPYHERAYDRLMIVYRKQRDYKKELQIINKAIAAFREHFEAGRKVAHSKRVVALSNSLAKSVGLSDRRGNAVYQPQPIARWMKRKELVEGKIKREKD